MSKTYSGILNNHDGGSLTSTNFRSTTFAKTGLDYFGPFYVSVERSFEKRRGFRFFLPKIPSDALRSGQNNGNKLLSDGSRKFVTRGGIQSVILSVYGTNFIAIEKANPWQNIMN